MICQLKTDIITLVKLYEKMQATVEKNWNKYGAV